MSGAPGSTRNGPTTGVAALAVVGAAVVAFVVLVLAPAAGAQVEPENQPTHGQVEEDIDCANPWWWTPSNWAGTVNSGGGDILPWSTHHLEFVFPTESQQWADAYVEQARKEAEQGNCRLAEWSPSGRCTPGMEPRHPGALPDRCWGRYPVDSYNITWDQGDLLDILSKFFGTITAFTFSIGKQAMQLALWLVGAAFQFDITAYSGIVDRIAERYDVRLGGPFGLGIVPWTALFAYAAITALRGRLGVAGGEIAVSLVVATVFAVLVANPGGYMNGVADAMDRSSTALLVAACDEDLLIATRDEERANATCDEDPANATRADAESAVLDLQRVLHEQFIEAPYHLVNWGRIPEGVCRNRAEFILSVGLPEAGGWSERYMRDENGASDELCADPATWNHNATPQRFGAALLSAVVAVSIALVLVGTALMLLIAKFLLAVLFVAVPFAAAVAVLPGTGRRLAWGWLSSVVQTLLVFVGSAAVLSVGALGIAAVTAQVPEDRPWDRTVLVGAVVGLLFVLRRRVQTGSQSLASSLSDSMTRLSPASANWQGGTSGFDLTRVDRAALIGSRRAGYAAAAGVGFPAVWAGRAILRRGRERRQARRAFRNLEAMERRREVPQLEYKHDTRPSPTKLTFEGSGGRRGGVPSAPAPKPTLRQRLTGRPGTAAAPAPSGGGDEFDFKGDGEMLPPSGGRYPNITMKIRPPRSFRYRPSDIVRPSQWLGRPAAAFMDRVRIARKEQSFQRMVRGHLDDHEIRNLGLRSRDDWHLGPRHGWSASDFARGRTSQRGFNRTTGAREGFGRQPLPLGPLRRLVPARRQWHSRGPSKWRRGNQ